MGNYCVPDRGRVALVTLSAQQDFARPGSPLRACGFDRALPAMRRVVDGFRDLGAPIFHSVRLYRPDGSNVDACRRQAIEEGLRILMPGSFGSELLDELKPDLNIRLNPDCLLNRRFQKLAANEWAFYRPRWGAFHDTGLERRLKDQGVTTVVICGFSFTTGTRATVYEASARDFRVVMVPDAICGGGEEAVQELGRMGIYFMTSQSCLGWLQSPSRPPAAA
jgi:nicotinamidase-related amidase